MNLYRNFFILKDKSNHSGTHQHETDKVFSDWSSLKKKIKCVELNNNNRKCIRGGFTQKKTKLISSKQRPLMYMYVYPSSLEES